MKDHETLVPESKNNQKNLDHFPKLMFTFCMMVALGFFIAALFLKG